jgi:hypothetical protein
MPQIETIFDHNITKKEMLDIFGLEITKEEYLRLRDADTMYADLFKLYKLRRDLARAKSFLLKIKDPAYRHHFDAPDVLG